MVHAAAGESGHDRMQPLSLQTHCVTRINDRTYAVPFVWAWYQTQTPVSSVAAWYIMWLFRNILHNVQDVPEKEEDLPHVGSLSQRCVNKNKEVP